MNAETQPIRILLADDHTLLRAGLKSLLNAEPDLEIIGEAEDGHACVRQAALLHPDLVLLDINMPNCNGLEALEVLRQQAPASRVLVLTMHNDTDYLRTVLACGGAGYVLKQAATDELLSAIRSVHRGGVFLHPQHMQAILGDESQEDDEDVSPEEDAEHVEDERYQSLSERETQIFKLVALGHHNSEIAGMLCLGVKTIETYKSRLMQKMGLRTRSALVRYALDLGILNEE